jgi:hypothetical protein
MEPSGG